MTRLFESPSEPEPADEHAFPLPPQTHGQPNPQQPVSGFYSLPQQQRWGPPPPVYPPTSGQQPPPLPPQPEPSNGIATAGFVVALVGAVLALIPIVGTVSWLISPVGLVLSVVGLFMAMRRPGHPRRGLAIAGVALGVAGLILCIAYTASFVNYMANPPATRSGATGATPHVAPSVPSPATSSASAQTTGNYGDSLTAGGLTLTVSAPRQISNQFLGPQVCSTVTYRNTGSSSESFNPFDWKFRTSSGVESSASIPFNSDSPLRSGQLSPGGTVSGQVCADDSISSASSVVYSPGFGILHRLEWS